MILGLQLESHQLKKWKILTFTTVRIEESLPQLIFEYFICRVYQNCTTVIRLTLRRFNSYKSIKQTCDSKVNIKTRKNVLERALESFTETTLGRVTVLQRGRQLFHKNTIWKILKLVILVCSRLWLLILPVLVSLKELEL